MPLDESDKKFIVEQVAAVKAENEALKTQLSKFQEEFPGMSKRHAKEASDELEKRLKPATPEPEPKGGKKKTEDDSDLSKVSAEVDSLKKQLKDKDRKAALSKAFGGVDLVDGVRDDYEDKLAGMVEEDDKGNLFIKLPKKLETTKETIMHPYSLDEGVKAFFDARPGLKKFKGSGGVGAGGNGSVSQGEKASFVGLDYRQLMDPRNAAALSEILAANPTEFERLKKEHLLKGNPTLKHIAR